MAGGASRPHCSRRRERRSRKTSNVLGETFSVRPPIKRAAFARACKKQAKFRPIESGTVFWEFPRAGRAFGQAHGLNRDVFARIIGAARRQRSSVLFWRASRLSEGPPDLFGQFHSDGARACRDLRLRWALVRRPRHVKPLSMARKGAERVRLGPEEPWGRFRGGGRPTAGRRPSNHHGIPIRHPRRRRIQFRIIFWAGEAKARLESA